MATVSGTDESKYEGCSIPRMSIARTQKVDDQQLSGKARELLECHPHFRGRSNWIEIKCSGNCMSLSGKLPSFFLKQLAQEVIRPLGDFKIVNRIVVTGTIGEMFCNQDIESIQNVEHQVFPNHPR